MLVFLLREMSHPTPSIFLLSFLSVYNFTTSLASSFTFFSFISKPSLIQPLLLITSCFTFYQQHLVPTWRYPVT
ncbi:hypothetical protein BDW42DRAFT_48943 [Aspergillus taichungensis]|uniref:Uncharacterized protein n=1 Tax=Aspergillus taichungensis TaxID=482145 RepID=A0A2J5I2Z3_9EURO|nr:hypothetical protein BDW42DRAFT_48943 [Aspergillus taichungensis]